MFARKSILAVALSSYLGSAGQARAADEELNCAKVTTEGITLTVSLPARIKIGDPVPFTVRFENPNSASAAAPRSAGFYVGKVTILRRNDGAVLPLDKSGIRWLDDDPLKMRSRGQSGYDYLSADRSDQRSMDLREYYPWMAGPYELRYAITLVDRVGKREFRVTVEGLRFEVVE
jgi:hypothetical protein